MDIIVVDNEILALKQIVRVLEGKGANVQGFQSGMEALNYLKKQKECNQMTRFVITDMSMPNMSGIELAKRIREENPETLVLFMTGYKVGGKDNNNISEIGYLYKPFRAEEVEKVLAGVSENLGKRVIDQKKQIVWIQTFGEFLVQINGVTIVFSQLEKELFAYLVHYRACSMPTKEINYFMETIQQNIERKSTRYVLWKISRKLRKAGALKLLKSNLRHIYLDWQQIDCDALLFAKGDVTFINRYCGNYMNEFNWAKWNLQHWIMDIE